MDFELSEEQRAVRDLCRDFAAEVVAPAAPDLDREHRFPYEIVRQMGEMGLFGLPFSEEWGGVGGDFLSYCIAIEEISRGDAGVGITLEAAVSLGAAPIHDFGTREQKERLLPDLLAGRRLWAFGLTEPGAGSDAGATRTRAELREGGWLINGAKQFITNSGTEISAGVTITAVTDRRADAARGEISAILVPQGTPGYSVLPPYRKLGWHSSDTHPLAFDDCEVPEENLLGRRGGGYQQFLRALTGGRIAIAALSVGLAQACLDAALSYSHERSAFGRPISAFQAIQFKIADMATEVELARLATYRAAVAYGGSQATMGEVQRMAAMAKLFASETSKRAADQAVQIHGGYGFIEDYPVARYWRDAKVNEIGEGTSEVQRMLIARELGC
ncbi:MAG: acyl-CoA dehydrogenase [Candidatus Nephthysia bennettiae]|uniref:Acyl-CoA dehydrogenase family protein n=1 Tax=Candidatus Nephthysia bennettiae TaxID=3127016 RepID=A0A934NBC2_9BACT|nr:acyl-CoA dehydrogenase family protein [Candidatus Dormibacteraeota bacterium]MBJ7612259.1 acyl-CoA dehydrogenase family protein [Candidatus Dormibacteraeota bacterium]PZR88000.1 MAG: acyl-CoA dehydrogenase [Candidatus Dormibacteraeota bacterium]